MFRFLSRLLGLLLLATGFVGLVIDGARSLANDAISFTSLGAVAYRLLGERYLQWQPAIERQHPFLWDPVFIKTMLAPAAVVAFVIGAMFLWLGRKRPEPIGYLAGR